MGWTEGFLQDQSGRISESPASVASWKTWNGFRGFISLLAFQSLERLREAVGAVRPAMGFVSSRRNGRSHSGSERHKMNQKAKKGSKQDPPAPWPT